MINNKKLGARSWKLIIESEIRKSDYALGLVMDRVEMMPEEILSNYVTEFSELIYFLYYNRIGFIKGKHLVICTELLFRHCDGEVNKFLKVI